MPIDAGCLVRFSCTGRSLLDGGESGIRTHGRFDPTPDFESGTFDHSAISPNRMAIIAFGYSLDLPQLKVALIP